jgi:hypothetical protein|tara:strand:- start:320 stop:1237 length:918 start_codon:yes stop_codon:yes gene_type:complete
MAVAACSHEEKRRYAAAFCCFIIAIAWLLPEPNDHVPPKKLQEIEKVLAQMASGEADKKAKEVAKQNGLVTSGSPCFMRHKRMALGVPQAFRMRFAAATIATDPEVKEKLLANLALNAPQGIVAWRISLAQAELAVRSSFTEKAEKFLNLAALEDVPTPCRADEFFLRAELASPASAVKFLDQAIEADAGYWTTQERIALLSAYGTGSDIATCDADAARTIRSANQLAALAQVDSQFQRLERALAGIKDNGRGALLRGMIQRATARPEMAIETWKSGLKKLTDAPCELALRRALEGMIFHLEGKT